MGKGNTKKERIVNTPKYEKIKKITFKRKTKVKFKPEKTQNVNAISNKEKALPKKKVILTPFRKEALKNTLQKQKEEYQNSKKKIKEEPFEKENRCLFVLRNDTKCLYHMAKRILKSLKLKKKFEGVLLANTEENMKKLFLVKPYVCYGFVSRLNFFNLMEKRLFLNVSGEIKRVDGNKIIQEHFGSYGINSFRSLCEHIYKCNNKADEILKKYVQPFDFTFLNNKTNMIFLQIEDVLQGPMHDRINEVLHKII